MNKVSLFDDRIRILDGPANYSTNAYQYYNESSRPEIGNARQLFERWFSQYPDEEKEELKSRFKVAFDPALYELYIYALFTKLGYSLKIHPEIPDTTKRPDYLALKDGERLYIEVKYMTMRSHTEQLLERRKNTLLDALNKIDASNFLLKLNRIYFKDRSQPSGKLIVKFFNEEIAKYDPNVYTSLLNENGFRGTPEILYDDDKITIEVQLIPKAPQYRGTDSRSIGMHETIVQFGNDSEDIISALETKATRYGLLNAPYIICLNKQCISLDALEVQEALYGSYHVSWSDNPVNRDEKWEFAGNGFFGSRRNPKFTRVSGVYITNANDGNLANTAQHLFRHNPFAQFPLDLTIKQSVRELLNIPQDYPKSI